MGEFSSRVLQVFSRAAPEQGGVISGDNPSHWSLTDPIRLWIIQLVIIIAMCQFLALIFARIRQPRVIAEVIAGVLLGPSVLGHIPNFRSRIFPTESIPSLTLTANIGLVLFLFLVALEIDVRLLRRNVVASISVSVAGLVFPLGLGAALGVAVFRQFGTPDVNQGFFVLFTAVAIGITAFPVLCRILTELKLLDTEVGLIVLSAGIGNDVVGWILLALTVALVNATSGLTALWVLLCCTGYVILLLYPGRWGYHWLAKRSGSLEQGSPTPMMMVLTLLIVFISAFFTDIIGVHAIFGGFVAGLIIPHKNGYAISIVEKLEDLVSIIFLPLYFTLSGLNTNLSLLNSGIIWGYVVLICVVALLSKFIACGAAAHFNGFNWREAGAIGSLMSCKGLVELIVLNIGLQAKILTPQTFSMFVVHAIFVTFITTPLVLLFYPSKYRVHQQTEDNLTKLERNQAGQNASDDVVKTRFTLILDKIESLPIAMTLSQLLQGPVSIDRSAHFIDEKAGKGRDSISDEDSAPTGSPNHITVDALRLLELSNRTSAVLRSTEADALIYNDPVVATYRAFGELNNFHVTASMSVVNFAEFPEAIASHVTNSRSDMAIIPWPRGTTSIEEEDDALRTVISARNPFDSMFHKTTTEDQTSSYVYSEFIRNVFSKTPSDIALFVDRGGSGVRSVGSAGMKKQHLFLAFIGGPDDRLALSFLVQLCARTDLSATVVRLAEVESGNAGDKIAAYNLPLLINATASYGDTVYPSHNTQTQITSRLADDVIWSNYTSSNSSAHSDNVVSALKRITFLTQSTVTPLRSAMDLAEAESRTNASIQGRKPLIVLAGRSRRLAAQSLSGELNRLMSETNMASSSNNMVAKTLGDVGAALIATNIAASLLILQAAPEVM